MNCLKNVVIWYEDHKHRCPYEPHLAELDPTFGLYTTAVWQCEAGHRYFQDLHSPLKPLSDSDPDSDKGEPLRACSQGPAGGQAGHSRSLPNPPVSVLYPASSLPSSILGRSCFFPGFLCPLRLWSGVGCLPARGRGWGPGAVVLLGHRGSL